MSTEAPTATPTAPATPTPLATSDTAKVTPGSKAWSEMTTEQRHAQLRGPENPRARGHSPARDYWEEVAERAASPQDRPAAADPAAAAPADDGAKFKVGKFEVSEGEIAAMLDRQAQEDLRKATIPPTAADYKLALPENFVAPGDVQFRFDEAGNKATFDAAKAWAHSRGLSQHDFSEMMGIYASHVAQQEAALAAISRAEIAKAGVNASQRVDAVAKWLTAEMGETDAKPIRATICTDAHLRFYERMMQRISSQGAASFSQSHRVPPDNKSIPGYENMTFEQRRFAQDQRAAQRR
jgi:hypothetical protein